MQKVCRARLIKYFLSGMETAGYGKWTAADWDNMSEPLKMLWTDAYKESRSSKKPKET